MGPGAFDSDSAGDLVSQAESMLRKPINKVISLKSFAAASYHYDAARAASMMLLVISQESHSISEESIEGAITALDRMRNDKVWMSSWKTPASAKKAIDGDIGRLGFELDHIRKERLRILRAFSK